jgi:para-nitrobenzyl esterase
VYGAASDEEAFRSAGDFASDQFIVYGTWKWIETQARTGKPVYRYQFDRTVPIPDAMKMTGLKTFGSAHAAELEYVYETFDSKKADWDADDRKVGAAMNTYWANFIKTGNPSGAGLAPWPDFAKEREVMHLNVESKAMPEQHRERYEFLQSMQSAAARQSPEAKEFK